jgi:thiosulfate dehydrogenase [quinone] large subunit
MTTMATSTTGQAPVQGTEGTTVTITSGGAIAIALLRLSIGFAFLWAFLDKLFGLGYSTASERAWIHGGSPTKGFLSHVDVGPLQSAFNSIAGSWWADTLFMLGLLGVGLAVMLGVFLNVSAIAGSLMMVLMWAAEWPLAQFTSSGDPSGSTNPFMDYHLIYALVLIVLAVIGAGRYFGIAPWWARVTGGKAWLR